MKQDVQKTLVCIQSDEFEQHKCKKKNKYFIANEVGNAD